MKRLRKALVAVMSIAAMVVQPVYPVMAYETVPAEERVDESVGSVEEAHQHEFSYTDNSDGTHTEYCRDGSCNYEAIEGHVYNDAGECICGAHKGDNDNIPEDNGIEVINELPDANMDGSGAENIAGGDWEYTDNCDGTHTALFIGDVPEGEENQYEDRIEEHAYNENGVCACGAVKESELTAECNGREFVAFGVIPDGAELVVKPADIEETQEKINETYDDYVVWEAYDIKIMVDGEEFQPEEHKISITIRNLELNPIDMGETLEESGSEDGGSTFTMTSVLHIGDDDSVEELVSQPTELEDGTPILEFETEGFSTFTIGGLNYNTTNAIITYKVDPDRSGAVKVYVLRDSADTSKYVLYFEGSGDIKDFASSIWSTYSGKVTKVYIADGVITIGESAFFGETALTTVVIKNSSSAGTKIGRAAFSGLTNLTVVDCDWYVDEVGDFAFQNCSSLELSSTGKLLDKSSDVKSIGKMAFKGCSGFNGSSIVVPIYTSTIGEGAFDNISLSEIKLRTNIQTIGDDGLGSATYCPDKILLQGTKLTSTYTLPVTYYKSDGTPVTELVAGTTYGRSNSTIITLTKKNPKTVAGPWVVSESSNDLTAEIQYYSGTSAANGYKLIFTKGRSSGNTIKNYDNASDVPWYSYRTSIKSIELPSEEYSIDTGKYSFYECSALTSVPGGIVAVGDYSFKGCSSLTGGIYQSGKSTFADCTSLQSVTISSAAQSIKDDAFSGCTALSTISYQDPTGNYLEKIWGKSFYDCSSITELEVLPSVHSIHVAAFNGCSGLKTLHISSAWLYDESAPNFDRCTSLEKIVLDTELTNTNGWRLPCTFYMADGTEVTKLTKGTYTDVTLYKNDPTVVGTWNIGKSTETDVVAKLVYINYPEMSDGYKLTITGSGAMKSWEYSSQVPWKDYKPDIKQVTLSDGITYIGPRAFMNCSALEDVSLPDTVTSIGSYAFSGCTSLDSIVLPTVIKTIADYSFQGTAIDTIDISGTITTIGYMAFANCPNLVTISCSASATQNITMGSYVFALSDPYSASNKLETTLNATNYHFVNYNWDDSFREIVTATVESSYKVALPAVCELVVSSGTMTGTINATVDIVSPSEDNTYYVDVTAPSSFEIYGDDSGAVSNISVSQDKTHFTIAENTAKVLGDENVTDTWRGISRISLSAVKPSVSDKYNGALAVQFAAGNASTP